MNFKLEQYCFLLQRIAIYGVDACTRADGQLVSGRPSFATEDEQSKITAA